MTRCISLPYACETTGRASAIPIALWAVDMELEHGVLEARPQVTFKPVVGAYVACVHLPGNESAPVEDCDIQYGRTNKAGWVSRRALDALGAPENVPPQPYTVAPAEAFWFLSSDDPVMFEEGSQCADASLLYGLPNETLRIFWCYDEALFHRFVQQLQAKPHAALESWGAQTYIVQPFGEPASLDALDLLSDQPLESGRPL